jgi:N-acetylglucosamine repressor
MDLITMRYVKTTPERNKLVIEAALRKFGPLSRAQLHELTRLQQSVISRLVGELLERGTLIEAGRADNVRGRKQVLLRLNEDRGFMVGLEFDSEKVVAATMDLHPRIKHTVTEPTRLDGGVAGLVEQLLSCTERVIRESGENARPLLGVGVADPGAVNTREGVTITCSTIEFWKNVPLVKIFQEEFSVPAWLEDEARSRTVAERVLGAGEMQEDMIYVDYGTGIGADVIVDGKVLGGRRWGVGEFGHTHLMEDGPPCQCGSLGCLEAIAGTAALQAKARKAIAEGGSSQALALAGGNLNKITGWTVLAAAKLGDKLCSTLVDEVAKFLGLGIANLVNLFHPSMIVLDRRLELAGRGILEQIVRIVRQQALSHFTQDLIFRFSKLGDEAGVLGMALIMLEQLFEIPVLKPPRFMIESLAVPLQRVSVV